MTIDPTSLTPSEQAALQATGWSPGQPLPAEIASGIDALSATSQDDLLNAIRRRYEPPTYSTEGNAPAASTTAPAAAASPAPATESPPDLTGAASSDQFTICPNCGYDCRGALLSPPLTETDKVTFLASLCGGRFEKTYKLFRDTITVVFVNLTDAEERELLAFVALPGTPQEQVNRYIDGWLGAMTRSIQIGPARYVAPDNVLERAAAFHAFLADRDAAIRRAIFDAHKLFRGLRERLTQQSLNENF